MTFLLASCNCEDVSQSTLQSPASKGTLMGLGVFSLSLSDARKRSISTAKFCMQGGLDERILARHCFRAETAAEVSKVLLSGQEALPAERRNAEGETADMDVDESASTEQGMTQSCSHSRWRLIVIKKLGIMSGNPRCR